MSIPTFFIVGAPKTGTTALASYLAEHPRIFMSRIKEPHYFALDLKRPVWVHDMEMYLSLFRRATKQHIAIGEASVWYLFSSVAVRGIREFNPDARIIVMLRNPIDMVASLHAQLLFSICEDQVLPQDAWRLQHERAQGRCLPRSVQTGMFPAECLQYAQVARLGEQLERTLSIFPAEQVHIIFLDDLKSDPKLVYEETLRFLGVPPDGRTTFPAINENKVLRFKWLGNPMNSGSSVGALISMLKRKFKFGGFGTMNLVRKLNGRPQRRVPLPPSFRAELADEFRDDILKLSRLVNRDLSAWLNLNENNLPESNDDPVAEDIAS